MGVAEALLPGMSDEKRFNLLRGIFAAGHLINIVMFFVPVLKVTRDLIIAKEEFWVSARDLATMALAAGDGRSVATAAVFYSFLLADIALLVLSFAKPVRSVFVVGALLGMIAFVVSLVVGPQSDEGVTLAGHPLAIVVGVLCSLASMLGFIIRPPMSDGLSAATFSSAISQARELLTRAAFSGSAGSDGIGQSGESPHPGPPRSLWVASGVIGLLLVGAAWATWRAHTPPLEVNFRNSVIGLGRVLVIRNQSMETLKVCQIKVRNANGQSVGPIGLGDIGPGESMELGWAELRDWRLVPGETITLSSAGYADKTVVVP